jgi:hypothetical protein
MLSKHYHWTVNLSLGAVIILAHLADRFQEWRPYLVASCALATLPALVVYFRRQWELTRK